MITTHIHKRSHRGFALLLTLVVVSVVLAIGLSILDGALKQLAISGTVRDSETAFHAAYAGAECAQFWTTNRTFVNSVIDTNANPALTNCLEGATPLISSTHAGVTGGRVHRLSYEDTWGPPANRICTQFDIYIFDTRNNPAGISRYTDSRLTYGGANGVDCIGNNVCTLVISRGYNRACNSLNSLRAIQREIVVRS